MTIQDLIANVQQRNQYTSKAEAAKAVEGVIAAIKSLTIEQACSGGGGGGGKLTLFGFGTFSVKHRKAKPARAGVNPFDGKPATIKAQPAKAVLAFKPAAAMKIELPG